MFNVIYFQNTGFIDFACAAKIRNNGDVLKCTDLLWFNSKKVYFVDYLQGKKHFTINP